MVAPDSESPPLGFTVRVCGRSVCESVVAGFGSLRLTWGFGSAGSDFVLVGAEAGSFVVVGGFVVDGASEVDGVLRSLNGTVVFGLTAVLSGAFVVVSGVLVVLSGAFVVVSGAVVDPGAGRMIAGGFEPDGVPPTS